MNTGRVIQRGAVKCQTHATICRFEQALNQNNISCEIKNPVLFSSYTVTCLCGCMLISHTILTSFMLIELLL